MSRQLAERTNDGVVVELTWLPIMEMVVIKATRSETGESLAATVPPQCALDAFYHPSAYLPKPELIFS